MGLLLHIIIALSLTWQILKPNLMLDSRRLQLLNVIGVDKVLLHVNAVDNLLLLLKHLLLVESLILGCQKLLVKRLRLVLLLLKILIEVLLRSLVVAFLDLYRNGHNLQVILTLIKLCQFMRHVVADRVDLIISVVSRYLINFLILVLERRINLLISTGSEHWSSKNLGDSLIAFKGVG